MPVSGAKPKPPGETIAKARQVHDWIEVENVPFEDANRRLTKHRPSGGKWPEAAIRRWRTWRRMPHAILWSDSDWDFCIDTVEIAALFYETQSTKYATELRTRERVLGTTADYRRDLRIRYVEPKEPRPVLALVTNVDDFRDL
jgi:hypothetical protein